MPDNPQSAPDGFFALPEHSVVALGGRDAVAFAHAQFMNDVTALAVGEWQWNGWLTPKGRVIALFALVKRDAETIWIMTHGADADSLTQQLQRFVFRRKTTIAVRDDLRVSGGFQTPSSTQAARVGNERPDVVELDLSADGGRRCLRISADAAFPNATLAARWKAFDLAHGLPWLPPSQLEQWTPQQLSLDRLQAYSVKKGCYPGQEIVARTHFLGQAKRELVLFEADAIVSEGSEISTDIRPLGTIVSTAQFGDDCLALGVMPIDRNATPMNTGGVAIIERPLQGGLAR
jgi:folate-binding protein YgfZ